MSKIRAFQSDPVVNFAKQKAKEKIERCESGTDSDSVCDVIRFAKERYGVNESWIVRSLARYMLNTVRKHDKLDNAWLVDGIPRLGDSHAVYMVWLEDGRYKCTCFTHTYGYARRANVCTHIGAVLFYTRQRRLDEIDKKD